MSSSSNQENRSFPSPEPFREVVEQKAPRRAFVNWLAGNACFLALSPPADAMPSSENHPNAEPLFSFTSVPVSSSDRVVVPEGYIAEVLYRWGDPINGQSPEFLQDASNSSEDQALQGGMGHDGMEYFPIPGIDSNKRGLLAINHEYTDQALLFSDGIAPLPPEKYPIEKIRKSIASHGVSIVEIEKQFDGNWRVIPSRFARRITADTPAKIAGPACKRLGDTVRGTVNNCAAGRTPWGTYLTCEENFQGVFGTNQAGFQPSAAQKVYGLQEDGFYYKIDNRKIPAYRWWDQLERFDLASSSNDSERFGYVVEIDPLAPDSPPIKRTALGRFRHENAELVVSPDGHVVVYMGDDEVDQHIYKFVSKDRLKKADANRQGLEISGDYLNHGTLYVARFDSDGTGRWLELAPGKNGIPSKEESVLDGFDDADICIRTRQAAKLAGATPMDRPEWLAVHPSSREVYASLTNNKSRHVADAANPRVKNLYGHIVRWREAGNDPISLRFQWDVFVFGGNPEAKTEEQRGNVQGDSYACPDGLKFDSSGILWIQTDMSSSVMGGPGFAELGHNMMLAVDPARGETRRFLTGPRGCEITGNAMTPDRTVMFVNIQHPGEPADELSDPTDPQKISNWPDGPKGGRPRSATIVIRRTDGRPIGT